MQNFKANISPNKDENQGSNQSGLNNSDIPNSSAAQLAYFQVCLKFISKNYIHDFHVKHQICCILKL